MNWRAIWTIVTKDLKMVRQSRMVLIPLIVVPLVILVLLPGGAVLVGMNSSAASDLSDLQMFLDNLPASISAELDGFEADQQMVAIMVLYFFAPLFLVVPLMVASVIAADSFAGEKERKTLEGLIYTPISDTELFVGKMLSALIPAVLVSLVGFIGYGLVSNVLAWPLMGRVFFPNLAWIVMMIWVTPAAAGLGLGAMILVSSKVRTFQDAYQMGSAVVIPVVLLVLGQAGGVVYFSVGMVLVIGFVLWLIDLALLWYGIKTFRRGELIAQL
jgi:ABC-type Na+ efflux pump permease subunit